MNATRQIIFWNKINLKYESHLRWLFDWVKENPFLFRNILRGTVRQLTRNNESENVMFTLDNLMELEFKIWLYIYKPEYLKLVNVTFFGEKMIDHHLIYDHESFICQELIISGLLIINLTISKLLF